MADAAYDAAAFIRDHAREQLKLGDVADAVGYSPFHLARLFTAAVRVSPMRYLAAHRFHLAKHLLLTEQLRVVDVCHEVGFSSPGTFTRRFKDAVGVAPGDLIAVADDLAERTPTPFRSGPGADSLTGRVELPDNDPAIGAEPLVWLGLYTQPEPSGVPGAGLLRKGTGDFQLPVLPSHPWLLATVVSAGAGPIEQLAPNAPRVAMHPAPIVRPTTVTLRFRPAYGWEAPILTALPALRKIGVSRA